jgi:hypothetical protein
LFQNPESESDIQHPLAHQAIQGLYILPDSQRRL